MFWRMGKRWWSIHVNTLLMEMEVSSDTFLEGLREVLHLFGAQETVAELSPLWPVWSHWL